MRNRKPVALLLMLRTNRVWRLSNLVGLMPMSTAPECVRVCVVCVCVCVCVCVFVCDFEVGMSYWT